MATAGTHPGCYNRSDESPPLKVQDGYSIIMDPSGESGVGAAKFKWIGNKFTKGCHAGREEWCGGCMWLPGALRRQAEQVG